MCVCTQRVRVHTHTRGALGAEELEPAGSFSVPAPGVAAGLAGSFLMEGKEVWEGREGSVSLATSDSLASPQIYLKPTGLSVRDLAQGHGELEW